MTKRDPIRELLDEMEIERFIAGFVHDAEDDVVTTVVLRRGGRDGRSRSRREPEPCAATIH